MKIESSNIHSSYEVANKIRMKLLLFVDKELLSNNKNLFTKLNKFEKTIEFTESFSYRTNRISSFSKTSTNENTPNTKEFRLISHKKTAPEIKNNNSNFNLIRGFKKYGSFTHGNKNLNDIIYLGGKIYSIKKFYKHSSCIPLYNKTRKDKNYLKKLCDSLKIPSKKKERRKSCDIYNYDSYYANALIKRVKKKKSEDTTCKQSDNIIKFLLKKTKKNQNYENNFKNSLK